MIKKQEESVGYLYEMEKKHGSHDQSTHGRRGSGSNAIAREGKEIIGDLGLHNPVLDKNTFQVTGEKPPTVSADSVSGFTKKNMMDTTTYFERRGYAVAKNSYSQGISPRRIESTIMSKDRFSAFLSEARHAIRNNVIGTHVRLDDHGSAEKNIYNKP